MFDNKYFLFLNLMNNFVFYVKIFMNTERDYMLDLNANYEITIFSIGDTKAGTKMGKMQVKNLSSNEIMNCILWEETLNRLDSKIFRVGNIIKITGASYNEKYNNCLVSSIELINEAKLGLDEKQIDEIFCRLIEYIDKIENKDLKEFVSTLIFENEEKFKTSPAAKTMHHNYWGGLLEHTVECLDILDSVIKSVYKNIDKDSAIAATILHDFGKIFEYSIDKETGSIEYVENFRKDWVSHSLYSFSICMNKGFKDVAKMIAAHHGRIEWGAIIDLDQKDLDPIHYLIHHIDDLSAKFGKITVNDLG